MRIALAIAVAMTVAAVAPSPAAAADDGINVDPGSPAGKEYALPLEQARRDAKGGGDGPSSGASQPKGGSTALFGEGIKPRRSAGGSAGSGGGQGGSGSRSEPRGRAKAPRPKVAARLSVPAGSSDGSIGLTGAGIALTVLLAAGSLGLVLRRALR